MSKKITPSKKKNLVRDRNRRMFSSLKFPDLFEMYIRFDLRKQTETCRWADPVKMFAHFKGQRKLSSIVSGEEGFGDGSQGVFFLGSRRELTAIASRFRDSPFPIGLILVGFPGETIFSGIPKKQSL